MDCYKEALHDFYYYHISAWDKDDIAMLAEENTVRTILETVADDVEPPVVPRTDPKNNVQWRSDARLVDRWGYDEFELLHIRRQRPGDDSSGWGERQFP